MVDVMAEARGQSDVRKGSQTKESRWPAFGSWKPKEARKQTVP